MEDKDEEDDRLCAEDALDALLDRLLDPLLHDLSRRHYPEIGAKIVAKQLEAAAWLYYFYLYKSFPELEYYNPQELCSKVVLLRIGLTHYVEQIKAKPSLAETRVEAACSAASLSSPGDGDVPITRVAVLLLSWDGKNCLLVKSLITRGVWSFVEAEVPENGNPLDSACSAIRENVGIDTGDVQLYRHFYRYRAMSQKGDCTRLYVLVCAKDVQTEPSLDVEDVQWISLEDLLLKAKGDFLSTFGWAVSPSPAVDYFHVYPLVDLISKIDKDDMLENLCKYEDENLAAVTKKILPPIHDRKRSFDELAEKTTLIVPDSDDEGEINGCRKKLCAGSQLTEISQIQHANGNGKGKEMKANGNLSMTNRRGVDHKIKLEDTQPEGKPFLLTDKNGTSSHNESSNNEKWNPAHHETLEDLRAKHLRLLQELKNLTTNYNLQVSALLNEIAQSSARLQEFETTKHYN